jgi:beta-galactosidase
MDTYINSSDMHMWRGTTWYRKHIYMPAEFAGKKVFLEFQGINVGAAVYVNGIFKPGNTRVTQPGNVTHVGGFLPFVLDITNDLKYGEENVLAVKVSNADSSFYKWPGFGVYEGFGMGWGGIVSPVYLHVTNKLHIPLNAYSPLKKWGTYVATISANADRAAIRIQTNVENENSFSSKVTLINSVIDSKNNIVLVLKSDKTIAAGSTVLFDLSGDIVNPDLWYPNNSPYGKPNLYKIVTTVTVKGKIIDTYESKTGLRTITWDGDYCYVNGKKHILRGFGHRNAYPALGSAIPEEIQWKDIKLIANAGGNALRVGHVPATEVMVSACDAYGILVMQNSGDNEWSLKNEPANTYKKEYDRDLIISFRNHPSIAVWESNNGIAMDGDKYLPAYTQSLVNQWDSLQPRIVSNRDNYPEKWPSDKLIMVGYTNAYKKVAGSPSVNFEVYGASWGGRKSFNIARDDYANEKQFVNWFIDDYNSDIKNKACGWIDWMLAETQGEGYTIYLNGKAHQKSLGSSAMDGNRFPKLKYNIYKNALWIDYSTKPGVVLQSSWNLSGVQIVDAWSNCPQVTLFLNGKNLGVRTPDSLTKRCTWKGIKWEKGILKVVGMDKEGKEVCSDQRVTSGAPYQIILSVEPELTRPDDSEFKLSANGSDAAIITAKIADKDGIWCPDAANDIVFEVSGEGNYRGSYDFYLDKSKPLDYNSPGNKQLQAEGGLMRVAIRSTFKPGNVVVNAVSKGLLSGTTSFTTYPVVSK